MHPIKLVFVLFAVISFHNSDAQRLMGSSRSTVGYIEDGRVMNSSRSTIGYIEDGRVMDSSRSTIGYVEDGRVLNSSRSTIGYYDSMLPGQAGVYFFFFF